jgi:hypothetical protein
MSELVSRTVRIRRGWLERLRGWDRLYETKMTHCHRVIYGRGATRDASENTARRRWEATFGQVTEVTEYDLAVEVQGDDLTVTLPGSGFRAVYYKPAGQQQLILRQRTEIDDHELLLPAWEAANDKACELGWIV